MKEKKIDQRKAQLARLLPDKELRRIKMQSILRSVLKAVRTEK